MISRQRRGSCLIVILSLLMLGAGAENPLPSALWRFDNAENRLEAAKGLDLVAGGTLSAAAGISAADGAVRLDPGASLLAYPDMDPSGGGGSSNQYTVLFDLNVAAYGSGQPLLTCRHVQPQAQLSITEDGALALNGKAVTDSGAIATGTWQRLLLSVDMNQLNGVLNLYLDGDLLTKQEPAWWESILGGSSIIADGPFALPSSDLHEPYCLPLSGPEGVADQVTLSTLALFDKALGEAEAKALATPVKPVLIETVTDPVYVGSLTELLALSPARYQTVFMFNQILDTGGVRIENLIIGADATLVSWDAAYINVIGQVVSVNVLTPTEGGYTAQCAWKMPGILGGLSEIMEVFIPQTGGIVPIGFHADIPNFAMGFAEIKVAYIDFFPEEGRLGGGGLLQMPTWDTAIGGSMELRFGIGPEILGYRMPDLTELGIAAAGLDIPIGEVLELFEADAAIRNENGLSNPLNLISSTLSGDFQIVVPPKIPIGGRVIFPFDIKASMEVNLHDGSFSAKGTGKILNQLEIGEMDFSYDPPYNAKFDGKFSMIIYEGSFGLSSSPGNVAGMIDGKIMVPQQIPIIGGWTLADAGASFHNDNFRGDLSIQVTPEIPSICTPQICFPQICIYPWYCDNTCWAWIFPYPCNCYVHTCCWTPPCIPPICTPAIPALKVHFGFAYDAGSGALSFNKEARNMVYNPWEKPICSELKTGDSGTFYFLNNWRTVEAASTNPLGEEKGFARAKDGSDKSTFTLTEAAPAAVFRVNYTNAAAKAVALSLQTPDGVTLNTNDTENSGALPTGFSNATGYTRFNPDNLEQVLVLLDPPLGDYLASVGNPDELGDYTVDMSLQDHLPTLSIDAITPAEVEGVYNIAWTDTDVESHNTIKIFLDHDREGLDGYLIATIEEDANDGDYRLDTTALNVHSGYYFVALQVDDGVNAPLHAYADAPITVTPEGAPDPVTQISYLPDDSTVHVSWAPNEDPEVVGYVVLYTDDSEDLTHFPYRVYVPADTTQLGATLTDLTPDQAYLLTVCAVAENGHRSLPADIIRVTPHQAGADFPPHIVSEPDNDATATFQYHYLPQFTDADLGGDYFWTLDYAPDGMAIDPASGLISWTPIESDAERDHDVCVRIQEGAGDQLSDTQAYTIYVYPPNIGNGIEAHTYAVTSHTGMNTTDGSEAGQKIFAIEGECYQHQVHVWGPTDDFQFELLAGPAGMSIDATGLITWETPEGAKGCWVRVGILAEGQHELEHDYYLHVHRKDFDPHQIEGETEGEEEAPLPWCCHKGELGGPPPAAPASPSSLSSRP